MFCRPKNRHPRLLSTSLVATLLVVGCSGSDTPPLGYVSGKVTLDGKPLEGAEITFQPSEGRPSTATTDADGNYTLIYSAEADGALLGEHKVVITTQRDAISSEGVGEDVEGREELLPAKYHSETELKKTIESGSQEINFELTSE